MTDIKILSDRIIFDGHSDSRQECETITLMCDNLAISKDFKTVKYEKGYAEFEKIGNVEGVKDLMFAPALYNLTINFDSNITQVVIDAEGGIVTCTESGSSYDNMTYKFDHSTALPFTVTLNNGYVLDNVTVTDNGGGSVTITSGNTFTGNYICGGSDCTITITSKKAAVKQKIDISTLSGWTDLSSGDHSVSVKTTARGYLDSASSNAVTVNKAAGGGYTITPTLTNVTGASGNATSISSGETKMLTFTAEDGYTLPDTVSVTGATGSWDKASGTLTLSNATGNVTFTIAGLPLSLIAPVDSVTSTSPTFTITGAGTITVDPWCIIEGTQITLADGTTKAIEDITYDDELLVWNFYAGRFDKAKPKWIKVAEVAPRYNLVKFSNGSEVGFVGAGGEKGYHRIFNKEAGAFTHTGCKDTPNGTTTFAQDETFPTVISQEVVEKEVKFYNVITENHYNLFANGILTSCKLSNKYHIENMRYIGEKLISDEQKKAYFERIENKRK